MLDQDQAALIYDLATRVLAFDDRGNIVGTPPGFDRAPIADAIATLEAEKDGAGGRALVVEFLSRLVPDLIAAQIDSAGTPSASRLAQQQLAAADMLALLGGKPDRPRRMTVQRGRAILDLPGWIPLEVLDALAWLAAEIDEPGIEQVRTAPAIASTVERRLAAGRNASEIVESTRQLLVALDHEFDGAVTPTVVELAAGRAKHDREGLTSQIVGVAGQRIEHGGLGARETETETYEKMMDQAMDQATKDMHKVVVVGPDQADDKWADYAMRLRSTLQNVRDDIDHPGIDAVISNALIGDMPEPLAELRERYPQDTVLAAVGWTPDGNTLEILAHLDEDGLRAIAELLADKPTSKISGRRVCTVYSIVDASTVFASVAGVAISTDMLRSMSDSVTLSSGHTITRAGDAWELWSRWQ